MKKGEQMTVWTHFWDMNSGGGRKEDWHHIFVEAPEEEAKGIFYARFGHNPERVTCTCCGGDYSISEGTLADLTGYHRHLRYASPLHKGQWREASLEERQEANRVARYFEPDEEIPEGWEVTDTFATRERPPLAFDAFLADPHFNDFGRRDTVLLISATDIKPEERDAPAPPAQGYVWVD